MSGEKQRSFAIWGWRNGVSSTAAQALSWLEEFFAPWMEVGEAAPLDYELGFDVAPGAFEALRGGLAGEPSGQAESFVQDGRVALDPYWRDARGVKTLLLGKGGIGYRVDAAARRAAIVAEQDGRRARLALLRAVRELAIIGARCRGALLVHGAAVARAGRVVAVSGPRETGKTTFLLHALADPELGLVANDRLLVRLEEGVATARGVPTIVSIREGTLAMLPELRERLAASRYSWSRSFAEIAGLAAGDHADGKPSPRQLCELLGAEPVAGGALAAMVFPRPATGNELRLERIPPERAAEAVRSGLLGELGPWPSAPLWLGGSFAERPTASATLDLCRELASRIPIYACALGPGVLADRRAMSDLLAEISGEPPL